MTFKKQTRMSFGAKGNSAKPACVSSTLIACLSLSAALMPLQAQAQTQGENLIQNPGFEDNLGPVFGNNLNGNSVSVAPWVLGSGNDSNVVRVDGPGGQTYLRGPESDARLPGAGVNQHYLDIVDGSNDFFQSFTVPGCRSLTTQDYFVSGFFSSRADPQGAPLVAAGAIRIRDGIGATGPIVPGPDISASAIQDRLNWTQLSGTYSLIVGQTYSYVVSMNNDTNFDEAFLSVTPPCIDAINDDFSATPIPFGGGGTPSIFLADSLNETSITGADVDVVLTDLDGLTGVTVNADGTLNIPAGTPEGLHTLTYQICEAGSTTNCDTATVIIVVEGPPPAPSLTMTKVADSTGPFTVGDVVTYTYTVTNNGNTAIDDIAINDTHNGSDPAPVPGDEALLTDNGTTGDSTDGAVDGIWDTLAPGDVVTFTGTYTVTAADAVTL